MGAFTHPLEHLVFELLEKHREIDVVLVPPYLGAPSHPARLREAYRLVAVDILEAMVRGGRLSRVEGLLADPRHPERGGFWYSLPVALAKAVPEKQAPLVQPLFVSVLVAARRLGIGATSCWNLVKERKLPVVRLGRRTLVSVAALEEFAAALSGKGLSLRS